MKDMLKKNSKNDEEFETLNMQKEVILEQLRKRKCRITKQRLLLLDIIFEGECSCCKEIYYRAVKEDQNIGVATVYRMINILEEIGTISRRDMYKIVYNKHGNQTCAIYFYDETVIYLSDIQLKQVISKGLECCGYAKDFGLKSIEMIQN